MEPGNYVQIGSCFDLSFCDSSSLLFIIILIIIAFYFYASIFQAVIGLPNDFLRLFPRDVQESVDREAALALQQQIGAFNPIGLAVSQSKLTIELFTNSISPFFKANTIGRLSITVAQAKLVKNYGITRMDPYVRLRVGHYIYETQSKCKLWSIQPSRSNPHCRF